MEDLSCNGSLMIFNHTRDLPEIVRHFMQFFVHESCGICVPCRSGNIDLLKKMDRILGSRATQHDLDEIVSWGELVKKTSRCGLGATSPKPMLSLLDNFPELVQEKVVRQKGPLLPAFDLNESRRGYLDAITILIDRRC